MHGIPPHLLPQAPPQVTSHFRCRNCGYDNYGAPVMRCPECGRRARDSSVSGGRILVLMVLLGATVFATWATYRILWLQSDYVTGDGRALQKPPMNPVNLRKACVEECGIRALIVFLSGAAICLWYAYFRVFEWGQGRRLMARARAILCIPESGR